MRIAVLALGLGLSATSITPCFAQEYHLYGVSPGDAAAWEVVKELGIPVEAVRPDGTAEVVLTSAELARFDAADATPVLLQADLERFYADRLAGSFQAIDPPFGNGSMGGYHTLAEVEQILDDFATDFPAICSAKSSIGLSVEGRDLWMVKISDNHAVDENEPELRIDSLHHAREVVSYETTLYFMDWLLENYGTDALATFLVNEREMYFVPIVNPDGLEYNRQTNPNGGGLWRKNRRNNGNGTFGIDLNRNYSYQWGFDNSGSSPTSSSETYRGPSPVSEPEIQAMEAFISSRNFSMALSAHTYSNLYLYAWGYICTTPPGVDNHDLIGQFYTQGNGYTFGPICQTLYSANGNTVDYDFGVHGTFGGTVEIGSSSDGFWPPISRLQPLMDENLPGYQRLALYAGAGIETGPFNWVETAGDGDGNFEPGEIFDLVLNLKNVGVMATGTTVTASLSVDNPDVTLLDSFHDFGTMAAFASANNGTAPLQIQIGAGATAGMAATVTTTLSYDGYGQPDTFTFAIGQPRALRTDDLETDYGWVTGVAGDTAATGQWERADPVAISSGSDAIQPADDHSVPGTLCAVTDGAGGSAGSGDVDSGFTTLLSPQFDLEDAVAPQLKYWRWYANLGGTANDDDFVVDISNDDGATWVNAETLGTTQNVWTEVTLMPADLLTLTDTMRLRFIAQDDPNNSVTEAAVDDLTVEVFNSGKALLTRYGSPVVNGNIRVQLLGAPGEGFLLYAATGGANVDLGPLGIWELDFGTFQRVMNGLLDGNGEFQASTALPPTLAGVEIHVQALMIGGSGNYLSNAVDFLVQ